jgi:hypothetical protein
MVNWGMRKLICTATVILIFFSLHAQTSVTRVYIQGGKDAWENFNKEVYLNPSFENGIVEYKNGKRYKSKLNYNRAVGAIQFIDEKGDTLALLEPEAISTASIGKELFYLKPVYLQKVLEKGKITLAKNEKIRIADKQKVGAMGIPHSEGTIDSYDRQYSRNNHYIDINEKLLLRKTTVYYFETADQPFTLVNKKNLLAAFPDSQEPIRKFIAENSTDFNKEEDIKQLAEFIGAL